jgi:hypothetical protein
MFFLKKNRAGPKARTGPGSGLDIAAHFFIRAFEPGPTEPEWAGPKRARPPVLTTLQPSANIKLIYLLLLFYFYLYNFG